MIKPFRLHVQNLRPLEAGPLAPHLASFAALLAQQRYCRVTGWNKLRLVAALSHWMAQTKLRLTNLNERSVAKFLEWRWRHYAYHSGDKCTPALLLQHLRQLDIIPPLTPAPLTPVDVIERTYGQYLRQERSFMSDSAEMLLRSFIRFAEAKRAPFVTTKLALKWATLPTGIKRVQSGSRLATVRRFAEYLSTVDPRTEVPSPKLLPCHIRRRPPQLYRDEDVRKLVELAYQIAPDNPIKGPTLGTLLGLLATTGLRVSEALKLDCDDVDWDREQLTIRLAKGNKTRLTPLHPSTVAALRHYTSIRDAIYPKRRNPAFFVWDGDVRLGYDSVNRWFLLVACQTGLRKPGDQHGPRVHDLRHHFAIQTMLRWYRTDTDVETRLPELSTYLGHVHVRDTYWYLSAVPELLQLATQRLQPKEAGR